MESSGKLLKEKLKSATEIAVKDASIASLYVVQERYIFYLARVLVECASRALSRAARHRIAIKYSRPRGEGSSIACDLPDDIRLDDIDGESRMHRAPLQMQPRRCHYVCIGGCLGF